MAYGRDNKRNYRGKKPQGKGGGGQRDFALWLNWDEDQEFYEGEFKENTFKATIKENGDLVFKLNKDKSVVAECQENDYGEYWSISLKGVTCYANELKTKKGDWVIRVKPTDFLPLDGDEDEEDEFEKPRSKKKTAKKTSRRASRKSEPEEEDSEEEEDKPKRGGRKKKARSSGKAKADDQEFEGKAKKKKGEKLHKEDEDKEPETDFDDIPF